MKLKFLGGMAVFAVLSVGSLSAQHVGLNGVLQRSMVERVQMPLVFSTRDSLFALSLPTAGEGPAEVYVQLTVGRNGRVKEKKTRVGANHVGQYVAPAFTAAAKGLRIDRDSVPALTGRDTSVVLTFPLEYRCVLDTMAKVWPSMEVDDYTAADYRYVSSLDGSNSEIVLQKRLRESGTTPIKTYSHALWLYKNALPTPIWYYLVFLGDSKY